MMQHHAESCHCTMCRDSEGKQHPIMWDRMNMSYGIPGDYTDPKMPARETMATATQQIDREARESGGIFEEIDAKMANHEPSTLEARCYMLERQVATLKAEMTLIKDRVAALESLLPTRVVG